MVLRPCDHPRTEEGLQIDSEAGCHPLASSEVAEVVAGHWWCSKLLAVFCVLQDLPVQQICLHLQLEVAQQIFALAVVVVMAHAEAAAAKLVPPQHHYGPSEPGVVVEGLVGFQSCFLYPED